MSGTVKVNLINSKVLLARLWENIAIHVGRHETLLRNFFNSHPDVFI